MKGFHVQRMVQPPINTVDATSPITDLLRVSSPQETKLIWTNHEKSTRGLVLTEEYPLTMLDVGFYCGMPIFKDHFKSIQLGSNGRDSQDL